MLEVHKAAYLQNLWVSSELMELETLQDGGDGRPGVSTALEPRHQAPSARYKREASAKMQLLLRRIHQFPNTCASQSPVGQTP